MEGVIPRVARSKARMPALAREGKRPLRPGDDKSLPETGSRPKHETRGTDVGSAGRECEKIVRTKTVDPVTGGHEVVQKNRPLDSERARQGLFVELPRQIGETPPTVDDRRRDRKDGNPRRRRFRRLFEKRADEGLKTVVVPGSPFGTTKTLDPAGGQKGELEKGFRPSDVTGENGRTRRIGSVRHVRLGRSGRPETV